MSKSITEQILQHVKVHGPCSYTELNKVYKSIGYGFIFPQEGFNDMHNAIEYSPVEDRGGSYSHHHASLRTPKRRRYSGKIEFLVKAPGHNGKYHYCDNKSYLERGWFKGHPLFMPEHKQAKFFIDIQEA